MNAFVSPKTLTGTPLVSTFAFERHPSEYPFQIRVVEIDGKPWFVAKDVCDVLGIRTPQNAYQRLDPSEVSKSVERTLGCSELGRTLSSSPKAASTSWSCAATSLSRSPSRTG
nr:Bro-N domain-containing protein [Stappia indica]